MLQEYAIFHMKKLPLGEQYCSPLYALLQIHKLRLARKYEQTSAFARLRYYPYTRI